MHIDLFQIDAFTHKPFAGNPAAVCPLEEPLPDETLQAIANENNLSETAFLLRERDAYRLRWFTPTVEVDLCGHATLASAHVLWEEGLIPKEKTAVFHTRSGELRARLLGGWIELDFPALNTRPAIAPDQLAAGLGAKIAAFADSSLYFVAEIKDPKTLRALKPDFGILSSFKPVVATSRAEPDSGYDFLSRMFGPSAGINEDPVTGSAHCVLSTYWAAKLGKHEFVAYQASARGGEMKVRLEGDRVKLAGKAVTVMKGKLML